MPAPAQARLRGAVPHHRSATSAVLLLHGGREVSAEATAARQLAVLRLLDWYAGLRRASSSAAVYLLRYRLRGWNAGGAGSARADTGSEGSTRDAEPAPVTDAREALAAIRARHGDVPVVLLGHSMGGRVAFALCDDPQVAGVCALAPWLPSDEPLAVRPESQRFVIAHGTADRTTSPAGSLDYARRLRAAGAQVARFELAGGGHGLLQRPHLWHRLAVGVPLGLAGDAELPGGVAAALTAAGDAGLQLPLGSVTGD